LDAQDPDAALIERIGRGEPSATRTLVAAKLPRILGLASRMLRDRAEAEDVAQEALVRVWRNLGAWRPERARFDTWLHAIVLNLCRDRLRRRRELTLERLPEPVDTTSSVEADLLEAERGQRVARAIAALPERQREAILLVHYQDLSGAEAAAALEISVEALESLLARARRTLRDRLAGPREGEA
jgi:RNA polymerase sigma-70 factor (ECF subfamily)